MSPAATTVTTDAEQATRPPEPWLATFARVLVHGFVRLSGRVLSDGNRYRAQQARIEGPLVVAVPARGRWRPGRSGRHRRTVGARVVADGDRYLIAYGAWAKAAPGGVEFDTWHRLVAERLTARYGVAVEQAAILSPA